MIKMGVYGLLRVGLRPARRRPRLVGRTRARDWARVSALLGVLYALMEHDLKRLLAYHSVENIGIIFIGLGAGLMFQSYGSRALGHCSAFVGGALPPVNHAVLQGACSSWAPARCCTRRDTRDMEELGGLIKRMPWTAALLPRRRRRHRGPAAAQRLRLRVARCSSRCSAARRAARRGGGAHAAGASACSR